MWKTAFVLGMMFSLKVSASSCNISDIEGIVAQLKQSPQEKHLKESTAKFLELKLEQELRRRRPEFSAGINLDKDEAKNQEITAELLFSIDDLRDYAFRQKLSSADQQLKLSEFEKDQNQRLFEVIVSMFRVSQSQFLLDRIDGLMATISSSENIYKNRPIRSRDEEIILSSLDLLRSHLSLKKSKLQDTLYENQLMLSKWEGADCSIDYKKFSEIVLNLNFDKNDDGQLVSLRDLQSKTEIYQNTLNIERRKLFNDLKIGPSFSREKTDQESVVRFGVAITFDLPGFTNSSQSYLDSTGTLTALEKIRSERNFLLDKTILVERFKKYSASLKNLPPHEKLEANIRKIKKTFDSGAVSPMVYLESYRTYIDFLEVSEDVRLSVLESYLKLRGLYVENNRL